MLEKRRKKTLPKFIKPEDLKKLLEAPLRTKVRDRLILRLLACCGLRVSEVGKLKIEDINMEKCSLTVRGGKTGDRIVPVDNITMDMIQFYLSNCEEKIGPVILSRKGNPISVRQLQYLVGHYGKKAGIPFELCHPHALRHSFAVSSLESGRSIRSVQKMLGHSSLTTTQIYLDITEDTINDDCKKNPLPY